jgi:hypothetical protein
LGLSPLEHGASRLKNALGRAARLIEATLSRKVKFTGLIQHSTQFD